MPRDRHASLQAVKNSAYAWRQAIYYLSLCDQPTQVRAHTRLREYLQATGNLRDRLSPAVDGLAHIIEGGSFNASRLASQAGAGRRFPGWAAGEHWMLPSTVAPSGRKTADDLSASEGPDSLGHTRPRKVASTSRTKGALCLV